MNRQRLLFLCIHNSARSQMAEGLLRALAGDRYEAHSAGTTATQVRPEAQQVMQESGIDISSQTSKTLDRYLHQQFDWVITVCDQATEVCPVGPEAVRRLHWPVSDPSAAEGTEEARIQVFRSVRDDLRQRIISWACPDRFFAATILGGRLHVTGVPDWGPWDSSRIDRFPEEQIVIVPETGDRLVRTREELETIIIAPTGVAPTRRIWIHGRLEDEARRIWEGMGKRAGKPPR
ncbi:MAG TPA: arsenate reductase ArsC [bacterium]|nr:arsenate reductase ArsC [bacterium]